MMSYAKTPEGRIKQAARMRAYRAANLEEMRAKDRARHNPSQARDYNLKNRYGLSLAEYQAMSEAQDHRCKACGRVESVIGRGGRLKPLAVDHDHETGEVRGLLCQACNMALGLLDDDVERLQALITYLKP